MEMDGEWVSVAEAASRLGLSVDGIRKRIDRHTLESRRAVNGRVQVYLPATALVEVEPEETALAHVEAGVAQLLDLVRSQAEQIGQLKAELSEARSEVRALRKTVLMLARERAEA